MATCLRRRKQGDIIQQRIDAIGDMMVGKLSCFLIFAVFDVLDRGYV